MGNVWQRDERVLRWVFAESQRAHGGFDFGYETNPPQPVPALDGMLSTDLQTSLWRLLQHGLILGDPPADPDCRQCVELSQKAMSGTPSWSGLRPTASGLIVLGEFPDVDRVMSAEGIRAILDALAIWASEEATPRLRQAARLVGRFGDDALRAAIATVSASARSVGPSPAMQSYGSDTVSQHREVLQLLARPGPIDAYGAFTLSDTRLRDLGVALTSAEMLHAIKALADLGYLGGGHGWIEGDPEVWQAEPTEFPFESVEYRHFFVSGRGLRALGEWPSFMDLTPATLAALLELLADEAADHAQAEEVRAAAWDIRVLGPGILDVAVGAATAAVAPHAPDR